LSYSTEIWGFNKFNDIERVHLKFCKRLLGVRKNVNSCSVYGELGRYPLFVNRYTRIIKYWSKIIHSNNVLINRLYIQGFEDCERGCNNLVSNVKKLLNSHGFGYAFYNTGNVDVNFPSMFKERVIDSYIQQWHTSVESSPVLYTYKWLKLNFGYQTYLDVLPFPLRCNITKIRLSSHSLRIQTGRYGANRIDRNQRICLYCDSGDIEDEFHFICICSRFNTLRNQYIKKYFYIRPSMFKFVELMKSCNKNVLSKLSKYIEEAMKLRNAVTVI
jgi:hypothetical protein